MKEVKGFTEYVRRAAAEGIVLLKNEGQMLPIKKGEEVAVFGRCQIDYYRSGTGSGGSVNVPYKVNALDGLRQNEYIEVNENLATVYETFIEKNPFENGGGAWAAEPWFQKEMPLTEEIVEEAKKTSEKAVIIIGRTAGEDQDNEDIEGGYRLTKLEMQMLENVTKHFDKVAVVLNVSSIVDMSWLDDEQLKSNLKAVLYSWQGGMEGGNALADVLSGNVTPSGKLSDTVAYNLNQYPSSKNFGDEQKNYYMEDIYVGYRYFETFNRQGVRFPFGYGLSYTQFQIETVRANVVGEGIKTEFDIHVKVTNIGDTYSGKEVVEVYYSAPQGLLGKPVLELCSFAKTKLLKPGESQTLTLKIPLSGMSSYDDGGVTGNKSSYVLEEGDYNLYVGNSVHHLEKIHFDDKPFYTVGELMLVDTLNEALAPREDFHRIKPGRPKKSGEFEAVYEPVPKRTTSLKERIEEYLPYEYKQTGNQGIKLKDVKENKNSLEQFIAQLSQKELEVIVRGEGMSSPKVTAGTAGAFGGVGDCLLRYGIPVACAADGPSGIRMDSGGEAVQLPIGTLLACTWDVSLMEELYTYEGQELVLNDIDTLLGPGINIHRHPLNGRNFEYFSEDPYLTGCMAKAALTGIRKGGSTGTIKHFASNDQEHKRRQVDSVVSERALREIHLRGFEIAVKEGKASSMMTSYNPINGIWSASNYDLNTTILRREWEYTGIVMTDWWAEMNDPILGGEASKKKTSCMVRAQNDIYMLVNNYGAEVNSMDDDLSEAIENGKLTIGELQRSAMNICRFLLNAPAIDRPIKIAEAKKILPLKTRAYNDKLNKVDTEILLNTKADTSFGVVVDEEGEYSIVVSMKNDQEESAQSSCNILLNDEYVTNIQLNGTNGLKVKEKNVNMILDKGIYDLKLIFTKPGLEIGSIILMKM